MNLSPARIVILIALALGGILALANGFPSGPATATAPSPSPEAVPDDQSPPPEDIDGGETDEGNEGGGGKAQNPAEVDFQVLNGTATSGLAATVQAVLVDAGYTKIAAPADDWPIKPLASTFVYFRPGEDQAETQQNRADARALAVVLRDSGIRPDVEPLPDEQQNPPSPLAAVIVIVGSDFVMANSGPADATTDTTTTPTVDPVPTGR